MSIKRLSAALVLSGMIFAITSPVLRGQTRTWSATSQTGTGDDFNRNANWTGNAPDTSGEFAQFTGTSNINPEVNASLTLGGLIFTAGATTGLNFTNTNTLTLASSSYGIDDASTATHTFANAFALGANQTWRMTATTGTLVFNHTVNLGSRTLTALPSNAGNNLTFNGVVSGSGSITKEGAGTLSLNAANSFSGGLTLSSGLTTLGSNTAAGTGTLTFAGGTVSALGGARTLTNTVSATGNIVIGGTNNLTFTGTIGLGGGDRTIEVSNSGTTTFAGAVSNPYYATTTKTGTGTLVLSGNNSGLTGPVIVSAGTLQLENTNALGSSTYNNAVSAGATLALSHGTGLTVNEGSISLAGSGADGNGALRNLSGSNTVSGTLALASAATIQSDAGSLSMAAIDGGSQNLTLQGVGNFNASGTINSLNSLTLAGTGTTTFTGSTNKNITSTAINSGTLLLNQTSGTTALSGTVTIGDGSGVGSDTLRLGASHQIADGTNVIINSTGNFDLANYDETLASITLHNGASVSTGTGTLAFSGNSPITSNASATTSTISGQIRLATNSNTVQVADGTADSDLTISAQISGAGTPSRLVKTGDGTLTLTGANTFQDTGNAWDSAVQIQAGTIAITTDAALGQANNNVALSSDTTLRADGSFAMGSGRQIEFAGNATLDVSGVNTVVHNGTVTGSGTVTKGGTGTLQLAAANTHSGNVVVNTGTLLVSHDQALGSGGTTTVNSGATLAVQGGITVATETNIALSGHGVDGGGALRNVSGNNIVNTPMTLGAATTITAAAGTLQLGTQATSPVLNLGAHNLTFNTAGGNIVVESDFTGTGDIYKNGSGTLTLNHGEAYPTILSTATDFFLNDGKTILNTYATENSGMRGDITIGDGLGGVGTAILQQGLYEAGVDNSNEIIANTSNVTVNADGYWDLQGHKEVVNHVTINGGTIDAKKDVGTANRLEIAGTLRSTSTTQTATINGLLGFNNDLTKSVIVDAGSTLDINALLSNGGFVKTGAGTLILSGGNSYTGTSQITAGIVRIDNNFGLGSTAGDTRVSSGGQLQLDQVTVGAEALQLAGSGISSTGALRAVNGPNSWAGNVALTAHAEIQTDSSATLTIGGNITGSGKTLTVDSVGNTTFNGNNTFNTLEKIGTGKLTVTGINTYAVANVNAGTFALGNSNILANTMDINLGAAGTFAVGSFTETIDDLNGSGTLTIAAGGVLGIDKIGDAGAFTGTLDIDGIMTLNGGLIGAGANGAPSSGTMMLNTASTLQIAASFAFGGTLELATGTTLKLTGNGTTFNLGTLRITGDTVIDFSGVDTTTFNIGTLIINPGVAVSAIGWSSFNDLWTAANFSGAALDLRNSATAQITFNGFTASDTIWRTYDYGANEITVPEPATYGALLMAAALATHLLRRRRLRQA
ncbi:beta strand repeat-containing protein [Synoicihabitans lomoniglobus]|uniref:Autotransporter-associated beta strand repeat-containing protein n=1 Tax=Synoicihabitans lomoniglobus TaxID=2909285 RepID=A0AAE9ZYJ1_9BACT|nr:autotransporter-associated beta strand repeat-containing protein [Opitutaceae bacterium LMO-M01]WED65579.1 autotransporter-associated beta strand repeat-containing protein [Opitutaceae bacterium LMO-M01]